MDQILLDIGIVGSICIIVLLTARDAITSRRASIFIVLGMALMVFGLCLEIDDRSTWLGTTEP